MAMKDKKWLVLSSNVILGPYTKEEVENLITQSHISVYDFITEPYTFWWVIKNHKDFKTFADNLASKSRINNIVTHVTEKISSLTISKTVPIDNNDTTITKKINVLPQIKKEKKTSKAKRVSAQVIKQPFSYKVFKKYLYLGAGLLACFILISYIVMKETQPSFQQDVFTFQNETKINKDNLGYQFYKDKNYKQAFSLFKEEEKNKKLSFDEAAILTSLYLGKGQVLQAHKLLKKLDEAQFSKSRYGKMTQGLIRIHDKELDRAESSFQEVQKEDFGVATLNLSIVKFLQGKHEDSLKYVFELIKQDLDRGFVFYLKTLNEAALGVDFSSDASIFLKKTPEYHQEYYFLLSYLYYTQGNKPLAYDFLKKTLLEDPFFSDEYFYNSFLAVNKISWSLLKSYCQDFSEQLFKKSLTHALQSLCFFKAGDFNTGQVFLKKALEELPQDPIVLSLQAYSLMLEDKHEQALVVIDKAIQNLTESLALPYKLQARAYEKLNKWDKALKSWKQVLKLDSADIAGLGGAALSYNSLLNSSEARRYKQKTLRQYPDYKKILEATF